jgi:hypothetical protein
MTFDTCRTLPPLSDCRLPVRTFSLLAEMSETQEAVVRIVRAFMMDPPHIGAPRMTVAIDGNWPLVASLPSRRAYAEQRTVDNKEKKPENFIAFWSGWVMQGYLQRVTRMAI